MSVFRFTECENGPRRHLSDAVLQGGVDAEDTVTFAGACRSQCHDPQTTIGDTEAPHTDRIRCARKPRASKQHHLMSDSRAHPIYKHAENFHAPLKHRRRYQLLDRGFIHRCLASVLHAVEQTLPFLLDLARHVRRPARLAELVPTPEPEDVRRVRVAANRAHELCGGVQAGSLRGARVGRRWGHIGLAGIAQDGGGVVHKALEEAFAVPSKVL